MGFWSGIKHALNSTLGTSDFKPLDKLIEDELDDLFEMVASDEFYGYLTETKVSTSAINHAAAESTFTANRNGSMRIVVESQFSGSTKNHNIRILINGEVAYSTGTPSASTIKIDQIINVNKGDVVNIVSGATSSYSGVSIKLSRVEAYMSLRIGKMLSI